MKERKKIKPIRGQPIVPDICFGLEDEMANVIRERFLPKIEPLYKRIKELEEENQELKRQIGFLSNKLAEETINPWTAETARILMEKRKYDSS